MKGLYIFFIAIGLFIVGCQGPEGPPGPRGNTGDPGPNAFVWDVTWTFNSPNYEAFWKLPDDFDLFESDVIQVYFQVDTDNDIWRPLPYWVRKDSTQLYYDYDFSFKLKEVGVFLDTMNTPTSQLTSNDLNNWLSMVVVIPGGFVESARLSTEDISGAELREKYTVISNPQYRK